MSGQDPKYFYFSKFYSVRYYHSTKYFIGGALLASYYWTKTQNTNQKYTVNPNSFHLAVNYLEYTAMSLD